MNRGWKIVGSGKDRVVIKALEGPEADLYEKLSVVNGPHIVLDGKDSFIYDDDGRILDVNQARNIAKWMSNAADILEEAKKGTFDES